MRGARPVRTVLVLAPFASLLVLSGCYARQVQPPAPEPRPVMSEGEGPPVSSSPEALLRTEGVALLQTVLGQRGYPVAVTGRFDRPTREALLVFQMHHELTPTSFPNLETLASLGLDARELYSDALSLGQRPEEVP